MSFENPFISTPEAEQPKKKEGDKKLKFNKKMSPLKAIGMAGAIFVGGLVAGARGEQPANTAEKGKADTTQVTPAKHGHERMEAQPISFNFNQDTGKAESFNVDSLVNSGSSGAGIELKQKEIALNTEGVAPDRDAQEAGKEFTVSGKSAAEVQKKIEKIKKEHDEQRTIISFDDGSGK